MGDGGYGNDLANRMKANRMKAKKKKAKKKRNQLDDYGEEFGAF